MRLKDASILVADDEVRLLSIFKRWFEQEGCRVLTAEDGEQALALLQNEPVDMLISDIRMPKMDGIELVKHVKQLQTYFPKIIFISGDSDIDERESCHLGIHRKLAKPIARAALVFAVKTCLTGKEARWSEPFAIVPEQNLTAVFASVESAKNQGLIAFGHGGFNIRSTLAVARGETIGLKLEFAADRNALAGQGVVRWRGEGHIGVEITFVEDSNRAWVIDLTEQNVTGSFIPRSAGVASAQPR
ncbi:response regulator receiver domain-containing protein [Roseiarcus fermentans]|uniref:Response regulator receiver domain-containing protein n=1 Tax=Roseiarcus fermentans TaxID=1473586 RepID=A0A366FT59_9HYPH|nr:response regulator [Roseiarcus fermentans]RBP17767.1 response regulator receiver domain-containing protein [Roseiarcus fermentans]